MTRLALPLACVLALAPLASLASPAVRRPATRAEIVHQALRSSVRVQVFSAGQLERSGSGVVVASGPGEGGQVRSEILTNAHVADQTGLQKVTYLVLCERHGHVVQRLPARLVAIGRLPDPDLAILQVDEALPPVTLALERAVEVGDEVVVVGAPYGKSLSVSGGMLSQIVSADTAPGQPLRFQSMKTDAAIGYGSSGGGVFVLPGGQLVGLVEGYRTARVDIDAHTGFDVPMPGETFLAPLTEVRGFLADHLGRTVFPQASGLEASSARPPAVPVPAAAMPVAGVH